MFEIEAVAFQRANQFNKKDNQVFHTEKKKGKISVSFGTSISLISSTWHMLFNISSEVYF